METSHLSPLTGDQYLVANFGSTSRKIAGVVPLKVQRNYAFDFDYDPVQQGALAGPMVTNGGAPTSSQADYFADGIILGLSNSVTGLNGITNIFTVSPTKSLSEVFQVWYGIAPALVRVYFKQPNDSFVGLGDQNMVPSKKFPNIGYIDGETSRYNRPSERTEFFSFVGVDPEFTFYNPYPWPVNPRLNFFVNRMLVNVVRNPEEIRKVLTHQVPQRNVTIGNPTSSVTFDGVPYDNVAPLDPEIVRLSEADFKAALQKAGYVEGGK